MTDDPRFAPTAEADVVLSGDAIVGTVPPELTGTLVRNGPADLRLADHEFDGDGMLRTLTFGPDEVRYRAKYIETTKRVAERDSATPKFREFGTQVPGGPLKNMEATRDANAANTSVMRQGDCYLALWEAGHPYAVDVETLATVGPFDFGGELPAKLPFSAHPKFDPTTGELFNFGMHFGSHTEIVTYRRDPNGSLHVVSTDRIPHALFNHDCALTSKWLVYLLGPAQYSLLPYLAGLKAIGDSVKWKPSEGLLVMLVARDGSQTIQFEVDPWFQFHIGGAFDDGDDVVVDLVRYPSWDSVANVLKDFRHPVQGTEGNLHRVRLSPNTKSARSEQLIPEGVEFPSFDLRLSTQPYRYAYLAQHPGLVGPGGIVRADVQAGTSEVFELPEGHHPSEPVFCPRPGGQPDDGWVVSWIWNSDRQATDAMIFDAHTIADGPVATLRLPNAGVTFHGMWDAASSGV